MQLLHSENTNGIMLQCEWKMSKTKMKKIREKKTEKWTGCTQETKLGHLKDGALISKEILLNWSITKLSNNLTKLT